jgi:hypothetical protein
MTPDDLTLWNAEAPYFPHYPAEFVGEGARPDKFPDLQPCLLIHFRNGAIGTRHHIVGGVTETPTPLKGGAIEAQLDGDPRIVARKTYKSGAQMRTEFRSMRFDLKEIRGQVRDLAEIERIGKRKEAVRQLLLRGK